MNLLIILILTTLFQYAVQAKTCRTARNWAFCQEKGFTEFPQDLSKNIVKLLLQGNSLKSDDTLDNRLRDFPKLIELNMNGNLLTSIPKNIPQKTGLLDLGGNEIISLKGNPLENLKLLRTLHLAGNNITSEQMDEIDLGKNPLTELTLDDNELSRLPGNLPRTLTRLTASRNGITTLKINGDLPNLQLLDLSFNLISNVDPGSFRFLPSLSNLCLGSNNLQEVPADIPVSLKKLHMSGNQIRYLYKSGNDVRSGVEDLLDLQVSL